MAEPPAGPLVTRSEYARRRGFSKQYVGQLVARGRIKLVDGLIDAVAADVALAEVHDPARYATRTSPVTVAAPDPASPGLQASFSKARTIREHYRALREKLEYEASTGATIARAVVEAGAEEAGRAVRLEVLAAAKPATSELVERHPDLDIAATETLIERHLLAALTRVADRLADHAVPNLAAAAGVEPSV